VNGFCFGGAVVLVAVVGVGALIASTFMGRKAIADGAEVGGARIVADGIVAFAVIPTGRRKVALVDAGNDSDGKALLAELTRRGLGPDAVTAVLLTHGHADHIGGLKKLPQAQVMAPDREVPLVEGREGTAGPLLRLMPLSPTGISVSRALHDGDWPARAPGALLVLEPGAKTGNQGTPQPLKRASGAGCRDRNG
jgi:glyoxylase-like metal-dependent hydrolase (beta-lactamase superfamily II)